MEVGGSQDDPPGFAAALDGGTRRSSTMKPAWLTIAILVSSLGGCGTPTQRVDPDQDDAIGGTGIDAADLRATADKMSRSILAMDRVFAHGTPYLVVQSPENRTRFQIDSSIFVQKIITLMTQNAGGRIQFIDREHWETIQKERQLKRSGAVSVPTDPSGQPNLAAAPLGTDYFLTGVLQAISKSSGKAVSDYVQATFRLVDAETGAILWQDDYDWKKIGAAGVIYR
jgi:PBP1b-binding outer membrane lipoprotein LpoB